MMAMERLRSLFRGARPMGDTPEAGAVEAQLEVLREQRKAREAQLRVLTTAIDMERERIERRIK